LPPPPEKIVKCFGALVFSNDSKTLSRRIIYAFSKSKHSPASGAGGRQEGFACRVLRLLTPAGGRKPKTPIMPTLGKNPAGAHGEWPKFMISLNVKYGKVKKLWTRIQKLSSLRERNCCASGCIMSGPPQDRSSSHHRTCCRSTDTCSKASISEKYTIIILFIRFPLLNCGP